MTQPFTTSEQINSRKEKKNVKKKKKEKKRKKEYCLAKFLIRADVCVTCHCHAMCGWLNALSKEGRKKAFTKKNVCHMYLSP